MGVMQAACGEAFMSRQIPFPGSGDEGISGKGLVHACASDKFLNLDLLALKMVSSQPRKQRKRLASASWSERRELLTAPLSKELQRQYGIKRLVIRKGDTVLVMRGDYKGIRGKVLTVSYAKERITVENASSKRANGEVIYHPIHASKVMLVELDTSDKRRMSAIEKRRKSMPGGGEEVVVQQGGSS